MASNHLDFPSGDNVMFYGTFLEMMEAQTTVTDPSRWNKCPYGT